MTQIPGCEYRSVISLWEGCACWKGLFCIAISQLPGAVNKEIVFSVARWTDLCKIRAKPAVSQSLLLGSSWLPIGLRTHPSPWVSSAQTSFQTGGGCWRTILRITSEEVFGRLLSSLNVLSSFFTVCSNTVLVRKSFTLQWVLWKLVQDMWWRFPKISLFA